MDKELIIATCLIPRFKLNWLEDNKKLNVELFLKSEFSCYENEMSEGNSKNDSDSDSNNDFLLYTDKNLFQQNNNSDPDFLNFLKNNNTDL